MKPEHDEGPAAHRTLDNASKQLTTASTILPPAADIQPTTPAWPDCVYVLSAQLPGGGTRRAVFLSASKAGERAAVWRARGWTVTRRKAALTFRGRA